MTDIITRIPGYSNKGMVKYCDTLKRVMLSTKDVKVGRGKDAKIEQVLKYRSDKPVIDKILNSHEHYLKLYTQDMARETRVKLRDYQTDIIDRAVRILHEHRFVYLAMEVRTGKTLTSLGIAEEVHADKVLFVTKKKAIGSIEADLQLFMPSYTATVINYESLHTVDHSGGWDLIILDEAHGMGAFPKPSNRASEVADLIRTYKPKVILLSGTPTPESYSQMYHQVYGIPNNPFREFSNFYRFCDKYVKVKQRKVNGMFVNDYSDGRPEILEAMSLYTINYTQKEAGFITETTEEVLEVQLKDSTYAMINRLKKDLVIEGKTELILADTPVKLMMKLHQMYSGTIKFESGESMVLDTTKAEFIRSRFANSKLGIFYKFKEELAALKQVFGGDLTTDLGVFEDTSKSIALQIVSGREGISLRQAEYLVYYNIDFSATSYWQSKDRMTTKDRPMNNVFWIFAKDGIEYDIYKAVSKKKDYTVAHFKKNLLTL
jgi:hypothetical protein